MFDLYILKELIKVIHYMRLLIVLLVKKVF